MGVGRGVIGLSCRPQCWVTLSQLTRESNLRHNSNRGFPTTQVLTTIAATNSTLYVANQHATLLPPFTSARRPSTVDTLLMEICFSLSFELVKWISPRLPIPLEKLFWPTPENSFWSPLVQQWSLHPCDQLLFGRISFTHSDRHGAVNERVYSYWKECMCAISMSTRLG